MPNILALDTSSDNCSVALWDGQSMYQQCEKAPRSHTQLVLPMVKSCLSNAELKPAGLNAIAFGCGPGSFTGIRIAAGVSQGLAYGSDCPIYAISNIKAMALQSYLKTGLAHVLVAIDARMDEVYWGYCRVSKLESDHGEVFYQVTVFEEERVSRPEGISCPEEIADEEIAGVGSGFAFLDRFPESVKSRLQSTDETVRPQADTICELARHAVHSGVSGRIEDAMPSYVRNTVTWKKLPGRE